MSRYDSDEERKKREIEADQQLRGKVGAAAADALESAVHGLLSGKNVAGLELHYTMRACARITGLAQSLRNGDMS